MERYGIMSPTLGMTTNFPTILLNDARIPDAENVRFHEGEIHRCRMRIAILTEGSPTFSDPVLRYHTLEKTDGTQYLFAFTENEVYKWVPGTPAWVAWSDYEGGDVGGLTDPVTRWSSRTWQDQVIATNGSDKILIGDDDTAHARVQRSLQTDG